MAEQTANFWKISVAMYDYAFDQFYHSLNFQADRLLRPHPDMSRSRNVAFCFVVQDE
jgi:hypothetical protein